MVGNSWVSSTMAHVSTCRLGMQQEDVIADQPAGMGDYKPAVGRGQSIGRHLVVFLVSYTGRLKQPHLHCRADAVA